MALKEFRADLIPKIRELETFAKRKILNMTLSGNLTASFKGRGMEFEGYRKYSQQDDASLIDWRASLRSQKLLIRDYNVEKNFFVYFMIDVSDSMLFASTEKLKCEYAAELVANMSFGIQGTGAGVGFGLFSDKINLHVQPKIGKQQYHMLRKALTNVENYGGNFDLEKCIKLVLSYIKQRTLIVIISDFIGLSGDWFKYLEILAQRFEIIGIMVRDPRDRELPRCKGQFVIQDPYSDEKIYIDIDDYKEIYKAYTNNDEQLIKRKFELIRSDFMFLTTDMTYRDPMLKMFRKRGKKWK